MAVTPKSSPVSSSPHAFPLRHTTAATHPAPGVRTIYLDPYDDWDSTDLAHVYDPGLVVGAAQRVLALVINLWDALDRKREMPIIPAAEVHFSEGQTWDLAVRVPPRFDPTAYVWSARPAVASF